MIATLAAFVVGFILGAVIAVEKSPVPDVAQDIAALEPDIEKCTRRMVDLQHENRLMAITLDATREENAQLRRSLQDISR